MHTGRASGLMHPQTQPDALPIPAALVTSLHSCAALQPAVHTAPSVQVSCCPTACRSMRPCAAGALKSTPGQLCTFLSPSTLFCLQAHAPMYINKHVWDESKTPVKYIANPADGERAAALLKVLTGSEELPEMPLSGKEALVTPRSATDALRWSSDMAQALLWLEFSCLVTILAGRHSPCAIEYGQLTLFPSHAVLPSAAGKRILSQSSA